jgi:tight adherence protein C
MEFASAIALFGSILLFFYWRMNQPDFGRDRMRALTPQSEEQASNDDPFTRRVLLPAAQSVVARVTELLPTALIGHVQRWLLISDASIGLSLFLALTFVFGVVLALGYLVVVVVMTGGPPAGALWFGLPVIAIVGVAFPLMSLRRRALDRQEKIVKALPESLDLLTTCVEAGLSLDYAFQRVADRQRGPVADEINHMLREKMLGKTRRDALTAMAERIDLPDVNVFVTSVIQAESQGTSIASVLRAQARQLRIRRRQHAEEVAQQAGPKMVFPLVFFILPSLFIVVLGPVAIDVWGGISGI